MIMKQNMAGCQPFLPRPEARYGPRGLPIGDRFRGETDPRRRRLGNLAAAGSGGVRGALP